MANKVKGEVAIEFEGKPMTLVFDFNAFCEFEAATGANALEVLERLEAGKVNATEMRALMWAALRDRHPEVTLKEAGRIIGSNNGAVMQALAASFGEGAEGNGQAADAPSA